VKTVQVDETQYIAVRNLSALTTAATALKEVSVDAFDGEVIDLEVLRQVLGQITFWRNQYSERINPE